MRLALKHSRPAAPVQLVRPLHESPAAVYLASLGSERSRITQLDRLNKLAEVMSQGAHDAVSLPWERLTYVHTQTLRTALAESISPKTGQPYSPSYINALLATLRAVLKEAWRLGLISEEHRARACDLKPVSGATLPAGRSLTIGEKQALSAVCQSDPGPAGPRDASIFVLGMTCGLRRAEMAALDLEDYDRETGELRVRRGKGRKARLVHVSTGCRAALDDWLHERGDVTGPLLCPVNRGGNITPRRISDHVVFVVCRKRAEQAGIQPFSPHDMRRTFIGDLLDAGADISVAQQLAGHASVSTTQGYDRRPEEKKREAAGLLHFPYVARRVPGTPNTNRGEDNE